MHRFDIKTIKNIELRRKTFKTTQNYKSDQIIMHCIDLTSKRSILLSYVAKQQKWSNYNELHRFDVKTIKRFELGRKITKWSNYSALHRFDVKTIENVEVYRKTFKITENYKTDQLQWIALTWGQNDQKTQNYKRNQITSN